MTASMCRYAYVRSHRGTNRGVTSGNTQKVSFPLARLCAFGRKSSFPWNTLALQQCFPRITQLAHRPMARCISLSRIYLRFLTGCPGTPISMQGPGRFERGGQHNSTAFPCPPLVHTNVGRAFVSCQNEGICKLFLPCFCESHHGSPRARSPLVILCRKK